MNIEEMKEDWNWKEAFSRAGLDINEVEKVYVSSEGANDGPDWIALCKTKDGKYTKMVAGCDFTGWDCQSWGFYEQYGTIGELFSRLTLTEDEIHRLRGRIAFADFGESLYLDWMV